MGELIMANGNRHFVGKEGSELMRFIDELHTLGLNNKVELPEVKSSI
jgi:hypothetical protein